MFICSIHNSIINRMQQFGGEQKRAVDYEILAHGTEVVPKALVTVEDDKVEFRRLCSGHPELITEMPARRRIVAIGDTHGDWETTLLLLKRARLVKIVDGEPHWDAEPPDTALVQLGDQIDRCRPFAKSCSDPSATINDENSDLKILRMFTRLDREARKVGGIVCNLLGNHELLNVEGKFGYVSYKNMQGTGGVKGRAEMFRPGGELARELACTRQAVVVIGDNLFVHGGIMRSFIDSIVDQDSGQDGRVALHWLNSRVRKWLLNENEKEIANIMAERGGALKRALNDEHFSPFWVRDFGKVPAGATAANNSVCKNELEPVLTTLRLGSMIIGHTPQRSGAVNETCFRKHGTIEQGGLIRVDIGASKAFAIADGHSPQERPVQLVEILEEPGKPRRVVIH